MKFSRRGMLEMIAQSTPVALAAHFGISTAMAADMRTELLKEHKMSTRTSVAMPGETFLDKQSIWYSVSGVAEVWEKELHRQHPAACPRELNRTCRVMARAIDNDLRTAGVGASDKKVLVMVPQLTFTSMPAFERTDSGPKFELAAGVVQETTLWSKRTKVGYIPRKIIVGEEIDTARRGLFGLK